MPSGHLKAHSSCSPLSQHRDWTSDCDCKGRRGTSTVQPLHAAAILSTCALVRFCTRIVFTLLRISLASASVRNCKVLRLALLRGLLAKVCLGKGHNVSNQSQGEQRDFGKDLPWTSSQFWKDLPRLIVGFVVSSSATSVTAIPSDRRWKSSWSAMIIVPPFLHLRPPVCAPAPSPPPPRMHMCLMCAHSKDHIKRRSSLLPYVCVTPKYDCPLVAIFCRPHPMFRNTSAQHRGATIKANITQHSVLRPADGHITNIAPLQQSHSNFNVAIKRSACSRGLAVGLTNTSCCGVCSAQPHKKSGEGWPLPPRQAKR